MTPEPTIPPPTPDDREIDDREIDHAIMARDYEIVSNPAHEEYSEAAAAYIRRCHAAETTLATRTKHWAEEECERERRLNAILGLPVDGAGDVMGVGLDEMIEMVVVKYAASEKQRADAAEKKLEAFLTTTVDCLKAITGASI